VFRDASLFGILSAASFLQNWGFTFSMDFQQQPKTSLSEADDFAVLFVTMLHLTGDIHTVSDL
jgi:hypothetical protein